MYILGVMFYLKAYMIGKHDQTPSLIITQHTCLGSLQRAIHLEIGTIDPSFSQ
jgi:hypothetical protein